MLVYSFKECPAERKRVASILTSCRESPSPLEAENVRGAGVCAGDAPGEGVGPPAGFSRAATSWSGDSSR